MYLNSCRHPTACVLCALKIMAHQFFSSQSGKSCPNWPWKWRRNLLLCSQSNMGWSRKDFDVPSLVWNTPSLASQKPFIKYEVIAKAAHNCTLHSVRFYQFSLSLVFQVIFNWQCMSFYIQKPLVILPLAGIFPTLSLSNEF